MTRVSKVMMVKAFIPVRRVLVLVVLSALAAGCGPLFAPPAPTPTPFRPANLLTPRPTLAPTATPQPTLTPLAEATTQPTAESAPSANPTSVVTIKGTMVKASEPLLGYLVDDRLDSPIIG